MAKTAIQELMSEFEDIKKNKCKTLQEVIFFDGVLAIIEAKYIEKEKQQICSAFENGMIKESSSSRHISDIEASKYYSKIYNN